MIEHEGKIIGSLREMLDRYERMEKFLEQLYHCGNAYSANQKEVMDFLNGDQTKGSNRTWYELGDIVDPDFDDSE